MLIGRNRERPGGRCSELMFHVLGVFCVLEIRNERARALTSDNFKVDLTEDASPPLPPPDLVVRARRATYRETIPGVSANGAKKAQSPRAAVKDATGIVRSHTSAAWNPTRISLGNAESCSHGKK